METRFGTTRGVTLLAAMLLAGSLHAAESVSDERGRTLVDTFANDITTLSSGFEQSLIDANGVVVERSSGTLEIQRPGQFRWTYSQPYEQWLVADGLNIWSYDVDLEQVTVKAQARALANTPALLLSGAESALDEFELKRAYIEGGLTWVELAPIDTSSGFNKVELGFSGDMLDRMVFFDNLEQTTFVALTDVRVNEPIAPERFQFEAPDYVDVVGTPVVADSESP